ncbi:MAG: efflux RND transporter periplasmic adaptor subunit [Bacteroidetes bacterium]|nr:efflux RND transporter periplasmic adaptor subunit [Bacteroidota bacterium]
MKMTILKTSIIVALAWGFISCQQQPEVVNDETAVEQTKGGITLTQDKIERAGIYFGKITPQLLSYDVSARGQVIIPPQNKASVSVMIGGVIRTINVVPGEPVRKGQVLATYSHPDFISIQQNYLDTKSHFALMKKEYERQQKLIGQNIKSEKEFEAMEAEYNRSVSALQAAEAELELLNVNIEKLENGEIVSYINIISPISGVVDKIYANIGMFADMQHPLFELVNLSDLMLQVKVFEKDIPLVKKGQRVTFSISGDDSEENEAFIDNVGSTVDSEGRVINVLATVKTRGLDLIPGMFVSSKIHTSEQMLEALPETAIIIDNDDDTYGFYTTDDVNGPSVTFQKFNVKTGFTEDGFVHVVPDQTLPENAMIAMDGVYYLKSELLKNLDE